MTHLIEKQTIELRLTRTKDAFELQQKVSTFCSNQLMPALDELFSKLAPMHKHIRLDELVIDLGNISEKALLSPAFLQQIVERVEQNIATQIRDNPEAIVVADKESDVFVQWLYFLENGRLPWYTHGLPPNFEADVPAVLARSEQAIVQLRRLLMQQSSALQRLIQQHKRDFLTLIVGIYTGKVQTDLVQVVDALERVFNREKGQFFWQLVFKQVIFRREKWTATDLIIRVLGELLEDFAKGLNTEGVIVKPNVLDDFPFLKETEAFLTKEQPSNAWVLLKKAHNIKPFPFKKAIDADGVILEINKLVHVPTSAMENLGNSRTEVRTTTSEIPKEIYISNAGVVLLHPFLSRLFENLGLTTNAVFKNETMRHKALGIIHYLATGEGSVLEYNLVLPKLLCEMPLNMPVNGRLVVTKKDKKECDKLLQVVIDYWSALGNTSPAGLREGFLQRKGKLINRPSGWLLQVERTTIDVLIDRLPWGLGIVKLPWMKAFLTVEW